MFISFDELGERAAAVKPQLLAAVDKAAAMLASAGLIVSAGSWVDTERDFACVFSRETLGPATYNSPRKCYTVSIRGDGVAHIY